MNSYKFKKLTNEHQFLSFILCKTKYDDFGILTNNIFYNHNNF